jgi:hypothetical protein
MSNLLTPLDVHLLEAVTGGTSTPTKTAGTPRSTGTSDLTDTLTALSNTIKDIGNAAKTSGFSTTEILMLGLMLNQSRNSVVFVRHPYW